MTKISLRRQALSTLTVRQACGLALLTLCAAGLSGWLGAKLGRDSEARELAAMDGCYGEEGVPTLRIVGHTLIYGDGRTTRFDLQTTNSGLILEPATVLAAYRRGGRTIVAPTNANSRRMILKDVALMITDGEAENMVRRLDKTECR